MKKKLLTFLQILFVTTLLFSCKKNAEISINAFNNSEIVSVDVARKVATAYALNNFSLSNNDRVSNPSLRNSSQPVRKEIESEEVIQSGELPYFYIFNFKNKGGWVIISAEKREHPILAYNNKGEFKKDNAPYGIVSRIETQKENIDFIRQGKFSTQQQAEAEWNVVGKELGIVEIQKIAPPEPGCQEYSTNVTKGPLLSTEWGQGCGYNTLCPPNTSGLYCGHFPTGCVATAMSQVMRYWQTPTTTYNWSSMPNTSGNTEVARLMRDAGSSVNMNYSDNGSGAKHEEIPPAMINTFTFSSAQNISYGIGSYSTIQNEINYSRPVILSGYNVKNSSWLGLIVEYQEGHEWVCDGYSATEYYWCNQDGSQGGAGYLYFHMNWGWDGTSNGFYGFDNWAPYGTGFNFQYYRRAIINIHP